MKTRYPLLTSKELKQLKKKSEFNLIDRKNNSYPIHKSISNEELSIFNSEELSLLGEISHLKDIGYCNFSIDGRWKDNDYVNVVEIYKSALEGKINEKELLKYCSKNTKANY